MQGVQGQMETFLSNVVPWTDNAFVNIHAFSIEQDKLRPRGSRATRTPTEAANFARWCDAQGWEVYVCMSSQRQPGVGKVDKRGNVNHRALRGEANTVELRSFWLDIDVKPGAYETVTDAVGALKGFCQVIGLPPPSLLVYSGGGLHAHWVLDRPVDPATWKPVASKLANACRQHGLMADTAVSTDVARILRLPGTTNRKYDAGRLVMLEIVGTQVEITTLVSVLSPFSDSGPAPKNFGRGIYPASSSEELDPTLFPARPASAQVSAVFAKFLNGLEPDDYTLAEVATGCPLIAEALRTGGAAYHEPLWFETGKVASFTQDGLVGFHLMSQGYARYDPAEVDEKYHYIVNSQQQADRGWPRCATIENAGSAVCRGCAHRTHNRSPLNFAQRISAAPKVTPASNPPPNSSTNSAIAPSSAPALLTMRKPATLLPCSVDGYAQHPMTGLVTHTVDGIEVQLWAYPIWNLEPWRIGENSGVAIHFDTQFDDTVWKHVIIPSAALADRRILREIVIARYGLALQEDDTKEFIRFMSTFLEQLRSKKVTAPVQENIGWSVDDGGNATGFVYGSTRFNCSGNTPFFQNDPMIKKIWTPTGSPDAWKAAVAMANAEKRPAIDTLIATAFASPLLRFTGHPGVIIAGYSPGSALHKTTALRIGQATWGSPEGINQLTDTQNSVMEKMGKTKVLPVYYDEMKASTDIAKFVSMVYTLSGGRGKGRLGRNAEIRDVGTWDALLVGASNDSLIQHLIEHDRSTEAGVNRVFEFEVERPEKPVGLIEMGDAGAILAKLKDNYGHAGLTYAEYLGQQVQRLPDLVTDTVNDYEKQFGARNDERFWIVSMAVLTLGAQMANNLNLTRFDVGAMIDFLSRSLNRLRTLRAAGDMDISKVNSVVSTLAFFINSNRRSTIITDTMQVPAGRMGGLSVVKVINHDDLRYTQMLTTHIATMDNMIRISKRQFLKWCKDNNIPGGVLLDNLTKLFGAKMLFSRLGIGTYFNAAAKEQLIEIDCSHPELVTLLSN